MTSGSRDPVVASAATVMLLRNGPGGISVLMLRRATDLTFGGGVWVFPGGRIDASDVIDDENELDIARRAAIREAEEEANLCLQPQDLLPLSHWTAPVEAPRRFATWFFVAEVGRVAPVQVDGSEIVDHEWVLAAEALRRRDAGAFALMVPTWISLRYISDYPDTASALAAITQTKHSVFQPRMATIDGIQVSLYAEDAEYSGVLSGPSTRRHRLWLDPLGWKYERDF